MGFFQHLNWALPPANFMLTTKPTWKWTADPSTILLYWQGWTAASQDANLKICTSGLPKQWEPEPSTVRQCPAITGVPLQSQENPVLPQNTYWIWTENITLAVILLSRKAQPECWPPECRSSCGVSGAFKDSVAVAHLGYFQKIFQKQFYRQPGFHPRFFAGQMI